MKRPSMPTAGLTLGLALLAAGCGASDAMLALSPGHVRFLLSGSPLPPDQPAATATLEGGGTGTGDITQPLADGDTDTPHRFFQSASVSITSILARNTDGVMVNVDMELPVTVDLISMENGKHVTLPDGDLPAGTYDQLLLVLKRFEGTTWDGTQITIVPPGGGWTVVVPVCPFEVDESVTTTVSLGFDLRDAFQWRDNRYSFHPRFHCDQDQPAQ